MALRTTHTYVHLAVSEAAFNEIRDRLVNAYPEGAKHEAEHYYERRKEFRPPADDNPVEKICLGEVALIVERGPHDKD